MFIHIRGFGVTLRRSIPATIMENEIRTTNNKYEEPIDIFEGRYYHFNKRLLSLIGQWPYQSASQRNRRALFILCLSMTGIGPQSLALVQSWGRLDLFVACFSPMLAHTVCDIKLLNCLHNYPKMIRILDETQADWERIRNTPQEKILRAHGEKGRGFTVMYCIMFYGGIFSWLMVPLVPKVMDILAPLNTSRERLEIIPTNHLVDPDKYFYPIFFHLTVGIIIVMSVPVAVDTLYMCLAQHVCAMFKVLRYNLEHILQEDDGTTVILKPDLHDDIEYHNIVSCIKRHKILIQYIKDIEDSSEWMLFIVVGLNLLSISFTGYQAVADNELLQDTLRFGMFTIAQTVHLFCITLPGHWISESSTFFPDYAYSCKWYLMSLRSRKLINLVIRASIEPCTITAGKIYVMSIENFCSVVQTSVSYLTVLTTAG